jgi:hypothetical protein
MLPIPLFLSAAPQTTPTVSVTCTGLQSTVDYNKYSFLSPHAGPTTHKKQQEWRRHTGGIQRIQIQEILKLQQIYYRHKVPQINNGDEKQKVIRPPNTQSTWQTTALSDISDPNGGHGVHWIIVGMVGAVFSF